MYTKFFKSIEHDLKIRLIYSVFNRSKKSNGRKIEDFNLN